jgi:hypothetical protein
MIKVVKLEDVLNALNALGIDFEYYQKDLIILKSGLNESFLKYYESTDIYEY